MPTDKDIAIKDRHIDKLRTQNARLLAALKAVLADCQPPALQAEGVVRAPKKRTIEQIIAAIAAAEQERTVNL